MTTLMLVVLASFATADRFGLVHGTGEVCADVGVGWTRFDFTWAGVERRPGEFDFSGIDTQLADFERHGIKVLPILDYGPAWNPDVSPADPDALDAWCRYVEATVRRYKDRLHYWQVWNEPNLSDFWKPAPDPIAYAELLKRSYETIKRVDPDLKVIGFNCSDIDFKFTQAVIDCGGLDHCDLLAYQPYRIAPEAGHFEEMEALRDLLAKHDAADKPIWFTEMGWASEHFPFSDAADLFAERPNRRHSEFLVRYMTLIMASGIERVFWFSQAADSHGLIDAKTGRKRMAYGVYQNFLRMIDGFTRVDEIIPHGYRDTYAYAFIIPNRAVVVAWRTTGSEQVQIPGAGAAVEIRDMEGGPVERMQDDFVMLSEAPVYLLFDSMPLALAGNAAIRVPSGRIWIEQGQTAQLPIRWDSTEVDPPRRIRVSATNGLVLRPRRSVNLHAGNATIEIAAPDAAPLGSRELILHPGIAVQRIEIVVTPKTLWTYQGEAKGLVTPALYRESEDDSVLENRDNRSILLTSFDHPAITSISMDGRKRWTYTTGTPVYGTANVDDILGDFRNEIVLVTPNDQTVHALDGNGTLLWKLQLPGPASKEKPQWEWTRATIYRVNGQDTSRILFGDSNGVLHCVSGKGELLWSKKVAEAPIDVPVLVEGNVANPVTEIIVASNDGWVQLLTPDGSVRARTCLNTRITSTPSLTWFDGRRGRGLVVTNSAEQLCRLPWDTFVPWCANLGGTADHGTGIALEYKSPRNSVLVSTRNNDVREYSPSGNLLNVYRTGAQLRCRPAIGDIDDDGEKEILIGSADWKLYCFGKRPWTMNMGGRIDASPMLEDVDGDGTTDIVQAVRGGKVVALSVK